MAIPPDPLSLPRPKAWANNDGRSLSLLSFISLELSLDGAYALTHLLWPHFVEVRGCILLPWAYEEANFEQWWAELNGNISRIEEVVNHLHLYDVFEASEDSETVEAAYRALAATLVRTWKEQLAVQFPEKRFEVTWQDGDTDYGPTVYVTSIQNC